jgi:hypothetical protein
LKQTLQYHIGDAQEQPPKTISPRRAASVASGRGNP